MCISIRSLMLEVLSVTTEAMEVGNHSHTSDFEKADKRLTLASCIVHLIASTPFKRLLAPYFTKLLNFHCGMKAKVISHGFLMTKLRYFLNYYLQIWVIYK